MTCRSSSVCVLCIALACSCRKREPAPTLSVYPAKVDSARAVSFNARPPERGTSPFAAQATFTLPQIPMGFFGTGIAAADFDADGDVDLLFANGNDVSPQVLALFSQQNGRFPARPTWVSEDADYQFGLCLGDVNADGRVDVGVALSSGREGVASRGGFKLYLNQGHEPAALPTQRLAGHPALACQFADLNGDGDLDLVLGGPPLNRQHLAGGVRVFLNDRGRFATSEAWAYEALDVGDLTLGDINQDGWLDLALAGAPKTAVFWGHAPVKGSPIFADEPDWTSAESYDFQYSIAFGVSADTPSLAVSASCTSGTDQNCNNTFALYQPLASHGARWTYRPPHDDPSLHFSKLALADVDGEGNLDLLTTSWRLSATWATGMPWQLFRGTANGAFEKEPSYASEDTPVGEQLLPLDVFHSCIESAVYEARVPDGSQRSIFTAPRSSVTRIRDVRASDARGRELEVSHRVSVLPGANWLAVTPPLGAGESIRFEYDYSTRPDVIVANWAPNGSNLTYLNGIPCHSGQPHPPSALRKE